MTTPNKIYILILNWNGWEDTIECLESVFRNNSENYQVIVCDNNSTDGSIEYIKAWAEGHLDVWTNNENPLRELTFPPIKKPIPYVEYEKEQTENGGGKSDAAVPLIFINTGKNMGFAGGNNVGLRYALARDDFDYVWLLNNDTVIEPSALYHMITCMMENPNAGLCGSTLLYYDQPEKIQALGGARYNKWFATSRHIGMLQNRNKPVDKRRVVSLMDYVVGASIFVSNSFLKNIGLMNEEYFLFFEEIDWATRALNKYALTYAEKSIVYHKEGSSINRSSTEQKSLTADFYSIRNRLLFTKKYHKKALPTVYSGMIYTLINRVRRRQWDRIIMVLKICACRRHWRPESLKISAIESDTDPYQGKSPENRRKKTECLLV